MYDSKEKQESKKLQHLAYCVPVRNQVVFERITSCKSQFSRCKKISVFPNRPIQLVEEHIYFWKENHSYEKQENLALFVL
jgi:hypothetical protein